MQTDNRLFSFHFRLCYSFLSVEPILQRKKDPLTLWEYGGVQIIKIANNFSLLTVSFGVYETVNVI